MLQRKAQSMPCQPQHACSLPSVKHVDHKQAKVPLQPLDVAVSAMENLDGACICKQVRQGRACIDGVWTVC